MKPNRSLLYDDTLSALLARGPRMAEAFRRAGLADCLGCAMNEFDTLREAVAHYGLDAERVERLLAAAYQETETCPRPSSSAPRSRR